MVAIKGLFSGRYLAMNKRGRLYASVSPGSLVGGRGSSQLPEHHLAGQRGHGQDPSPCDTAPRALPAASV